MWKVWTASRESIAEVHSFGDYESARVWAGEFWESLANWDSVSVHVAQSSDEVREQLAKAWEDDPCVRCFEKFGACDC
jgi:hypothetical protein